MCLFILLLVFGPRTVVVVWWLLVAPGGLVGLDYLWLVLAVLADLSSYAGSGLYGQRRRRAEATP